MGFFDLGPYDNDFALDWLGEHTETDSIDTLLDDLCRETVRPEVLDADAAAFVLATTALLLDLAGLRQHRPPDCPRPAFTGQTVTAAHWRRLLPLLDRVPHSEITVLLRGSPASQALWLENAGRIRADVIAMCVQQS